MRLARRVAQSLLLFVLLAPTLPTSGQLQSFDDNLNVPNDSPAASFVQRPSGQKTIFYIDAPGHTYKRFGLSLDSMTQVQNFTTQFCSTTVQNACSTVTWHFKLVVSSGGQLNVASSSADLGTISTNF